MSDQSTVLVIEDDKKMVNLIKIHLTDLDLKVDEAYDGNAGLEKALNNDYNLIILDLMLPGLDGIEVCKEFRLKNKYTPVLMLTAKTEELDKVLGLEVGADDYLTKPFSVRELIARVKAILRRIKVDKENKTSEQESKQLDFGELFIDIDKHQVRVDDKYVELTAKEFDLLTLFAKHPGRIYNREILLDLIWGYQYEGYQHTVNSHINRLRNKIEKDPTNPKFIKTLWGVGYRFEIPEEEEV
ncbi:MAG: response regulator transcription factor [Calditrichaceae bacterium]|jgi:two-component system, OmpR family, alkaline phosphatase synthesis response regulator PhoP